MVCNDYHNSNLISVVSWIIIKNKGFLKLSSYLFIFMWELKSLQKYIFVLFYPAPCHTWIFSSKSEARRLISTSRVGNRLGQPGAGLELYISSTQVHPDIKLPVLYLVDSIIKNVGGGYTQKFAQSIVNMFTRTFKLVIGFPF